jgi:hypothetical protein
LEVPAATAQKNDNEEVGKARCGGKDASKKDSDSALPVAAASVDEDDN